jgi:AcrR family transcriptional regulator
MLYKSYCGGINMTSKQSKSALTRRERKKNETRLKILEAAEELYTNETSLKVSMEDISERADVSRITLYNHFTNQDCIILNIGIKNMKRIRKRQREKISPKFTGFAQVRLLFQDFLSGFLANPLDHKIWLFFLNLNAKAETPAEVIVERIDRGLIIKDELEYLMALYLKEVTAVEEIWVESINIGQKDGTIRDDYDSEQLTHYLHILLSGLVYTFDVEKFQLEKVNLGKDIISRVTLEVVSRFLSPARESVQKLF